VFVSEVKEQQGNNIKWFTTVLHLGAEVHQAGMLFPFFGFLTTQSGLFSIDVSLIEDIVNITCDLPHRT